MRNIITSEYVSEGHPDKVADQISDALLDAFILKNKDAKVAIETLIKNNTVIIAGEVTTENKLSDNEIENVIRKTINDIGYDDVSKFGFSGHDCEIIKLLTEQSPQINNAVVGTKNILNAGDQGIMFGYATNETLTAMPMPIQLAKEFIQSATYMRKNGYDFLYPDMKCQVSVEYNGVSPIAVNDIVFSTSHSPKSTISDVNDIFNKIFESIKNKYSHLSWNDTYVYINPAGEWNICGPFADTGLTGRKIVVDSYGGSSMVGGGAFSGKDKTKVDRSGAYMARHIALHTLREALEYEDMPLNISVNIAYSIGVDYPLVIDIKANGTSVEFPYEYYDLCKPINIINKFNMGSPIYLPTAKYGHFGNKSENGLFLWENADLFN